MEMAVYTQEMASFDRPADPVLAPSAWVLRWAHLIRPLGRVLDLAAGHGRHARALQAMGHNVLAADIDVSGLADAAGIEVRAVDLETGAVVGTTISGGAAGDTDTMSERSPMQ